MAIIVALKSFYTDFLRILIQTRNFVRVSYFEFTLQIMLHNARIALLKNEINRFEQARKKMARKVTTLARNSSIKVSF